MPLSGPRKGIIGPWSHNFPETGVPGPAIGFLQESLRWGYDIPYMITGLLNQHPRSAMQFNASKDRGDIVKFFDSMVEEE